MLRKAGEAAKAPALPMIHFIYFIVDSVDDDVHSVSLLTKFTCSALLLRRWDGVIVSMQSHQGRP